MKKLLSFLLAMTLLLSAGTISYAEENGLGPDYQQMLVSTTAGSNGYYQYDDNVDSFVYVPAPDFESLNTTPISDTIQDDITADISPNAVFPPDSRVKVTTPTGRFTSTCLIGCRYGYDDPDNDVVSATGWLLNNSYLATAGHALYRKMYENNENNGYALHVAIYVGASGGNSKQYRLGKVHSVGGDYVKNPSGTSTYGTIGILDDWGVVKLDSPVTASGIEYLGLFSVSGAYQMMNRTYYTQGYPADLNRDAGISKWDNYYMYMSSGHIVGDRTRVLSCVYTDFDTSPGQSGSPIYSQRSGYGYTAEAIHVCCSDAQYYNTAVLITPWLANHFYDLIL